MSGTLLSGQFLNNVSVLNYSTTFSVGDPTMGSANNGNVSFHVPEPTSVALLGLGTLALMFARRRLGRSSRS